VAKPRKEGVDWEAVEREYREGVRSVPWVAKRHGISAPSIYQMAKRHGWVRNPDAAAVREEAHRQADSREIVILRDRRTEAPGYQAPNPADSILPQERLDALGQVGADILISHRTDIDTMRKVVSSMTHELIEASENRVLFSERIEEYFTAQALADPLLAKQHMQEAKRALHAVSLSGRSKIMSNLTASAKILIEAERKAWRLDDEGDKRSYEELLAEIVADADMAKLPQPEEEQEEET
jgi:hypothetical protein